MSIARDAAIGALLGPSAIARAEAPLATESEEQRAVIEWWSHACTGYKLPEFALFAVPNGGARHIATAGRLKAEGVRRGIPDLMLAVPRTIGPQHDADHYPGLFVEMKRKKGGRLSPEQDEVSKWLLAQGYECVICNGADEAIRAVQYYLR